MPSICTDLASAARVKVGRATFWYPDGKLETEQSYVNGALDGSSIHYRRDGTKSSRIDHRLGEETGQAAWDEQGKLLYARGSAEKEK